VSLRNSNLVLWTLLAAAVLVVLAIPVGRRWALPFVESETDPIVVRIDFSDERTWARLRQEIATFRGPLGASAPIEFLDESSLNGASLSQVQAALPPSYLHSFVIIADARTMTHPEHPLLVVALRLDAGREFRAAPNTVLDIAVNLSLANMDFGDFADEADRTEGGVFRGFR
jgi:hypothetical protein